MTITLDILRAAGALAVAAAFASAPGAAQTHLDRANIVRSLGEVDAAAREIDAQELIRLVRQRIQSDAPADQGLPIFDRLNRMPQLTLEIVFDFNRAEVRPQSYVTLGRIADALHHPVLAHHTFLVVGHTDAVGGRQANLELSQRRAEAIVEALTTTFGLAPRQLIAIGLGEEQLRDPAHPDSEVNRRVQLITVGRSR